jgi:hypothetical protein
VPPPRLARVVRWYIFKPKIPIWVNFGGPWNEKGWYIHSFGIHYGHLVYFMAIWYTFPRFGISCQDKSGSSAAKVRSSISKNTFEHESIWNEYIQPDFYGSGRSTPDFGVEDHKSAFKSQPAIILAGVAATCL